MRLIGSFCLYSSPLNSLWGAMQLLETPLGSFCPSLVLPLVLFGPPWGAFGLSLAPFGSPWGPLWALFRKSWKVPLQRGPKADFLIDVRSGIIGQELIRGIPGIPGIRGSGVSNYSLGPTSNA